jgi:hypothetical protein
MARMSELARKRLAKYMALWCFRNTKLESLHAGISPSSQAGDYTDVTVVSPYGPIPWNGVSRISDAAMKGLMIDVVNKCYAFLGLLYGQRGEMLIEFLTQTDPCPQWHDPEPPTALDRAKMDRAMRLDRAIRRAAPKPPKVGQWHPYADKWYPHTLTCIDCGTEKPPHDHPTGWTKRYTPATRTQARCPTCSTRGGSMTDPMFDVTLTCHECRMVLSTIRNVDMKNADLVTFAMRDHITREHPGLAAPRQP